jgi:REP element-mobilizing transposase RayT
MGKTLGYMVTWTTYGSWLQGDARGFVKDGNILGENKGLEQANRKMLIGDRFKLKKEQRDVARRDILLEAERIGEKILAISVCSNHIHVVIGKGGNSVDKVVNRFKSAAYYALRKSGVEGRVWTRGYDKRFCFDENSLAERIKYVEGHR